MTVAKFREYSVNSGKGSNMLKKAAFAIAAASAFVAVAPAQAAVVVDQTLTVNGAFPHFAAGASQFVQNDTFDLTYRFTIPVNAASGATVSTITIGDSDVTFTSLLLNGVALTFIGEDGFGGKSYSTNQELTGGFENILSLQGGVTGAAQINTAISITAVPEPGTWALFILGFGALGYAMRRRNAKVTVAKANLHFA